MLPFNRTFVGCAKFPARHSSCWRDPAWPEPRRQQPRKMRNGLSPMSLYVPFLRASTFAYLASFAVVKLSVVCDCCAWRGVHLGPGLSLSCHVFDGIPNKATVLAGAIRLVKTRNALSPTLCPPNVAVRALFTRCGFRMFCIFRGCESPSRQISAKTELPSMVWPPGRFIPLL